MKDTQVDRLSITIKEAAQLYGISENTFRKLMFKPDFPKVNVGRRILIIRSKLIEYMERLSESRMV